MTAPLPVLQLDKRTYERALSCVHCGLCLAACPTYIQTGREADGPRGRIQLIRGLADGTAEATQSVRDHLDLCLDCRACETACPSNVVYHELIEEARVGLNHTEAMPWSMRLALNVLTHPTRLKLALLPLHLVRFLGLVKFLPRKLKDAANGIGSAPVWPAKLTAEIGDGNQPSVGLLTGCVGSVVFGDLNRKAVELLKAAGIAVSAPRRQVCCGAIHFHNGDRATAQAMARRNIDTFMPENGKPVETIVAMAAGCGAMLAEYGFVLRDEAKYAKRAAEFSARVKDVTELLDQLPLPPLTHPVEMTVTYHDACHLAHAQKVTAPPRRLLAKIPGLKLLPLRESDMCCGAAGTYFMTQPEMAGKLGRRKLDNIASTGAQACVIGNAGCTMHLRARAMASGGELKIVHPVDLLYASAFGSG